MLLKTGVKEPETRLEFMLNLKLNTELQYWQCS